MSTIAIETDILRHSLSNRLARGVMRTLEKASPTQLSNALQAETDEETLLRVLLLPEALSIVTEANPLAAALLRGVEGKKRLLTAEGGTMTAEQLGELLQLTRQAVDKRRKAGQLIGLNLGRRGYAYPAWQIHEGKVLEGLDEVLKTLRKHDPWMQTQFMLQPNSRSGNRPPLHLLRDGKTKEVCAVARAFGEHGAA